MLVYDTYTRPNRLKIHSWIDRYTFVPCTKYNIITLTPRNKKKKNERKKPLRNWPLIY